MWRKIVALAVCFMATLTAGVWYTTTDFGSVEPVEHPQLDSVDALQKSKRTEFGVELSPKGDLSKTYMDYRSIKNTSSKQWNLLQTMDVCDDGFIRDSDGYIAVALGSYFGDIGSKWVFYLDGGKTLPVVKVDQKQDKHTCKDNIYGLDNWDIIEFIVDGSKMPKFPNGYVYGGNFNNNPDVSGEVVGWVEVESERDT